MQVDGQQQPTSGQAQLIDGTAIAKKMRENIAERIKEIQAKHPRFKPSLAIIQQGDRPDSSVYVRMKAKAAAEANIAFQHIVLPEDASEEQVMAAVEKLNGEESVNGLLVQLPLSDSIGKLGERRITEAVSPDKDADGFANVNIGMLSSRASDPLFPPCTPAGAMVLLESTGIEIAGKHAVVLGRSDIVGSPVCAMLRRKDATVTQCHSRTQNLPEIVSGGCCRGCLQSMLASSARLSSRRVFFLDMVTDGLPAPRRLLRPSGYLSDPSRTKKHKPKPT